MRLTEVGAQSYLSLKADYQYIRKDDNLETILQGLQDDIILCGLDAEWPPNKGQTSRGPIAATLAQLALRLSSGKAVVLVVDLKELSKTSRENLLAKVILNNKIVKVGYGLKSDLLALGAYIVKEKLIGPEWIDLRVFHGELINPRGSAIGLQDLTSLLLGAPLDKDLQCSSWGERPLSTPQLAYAALDAACLLDLFDKTAERLLKKKNVEIDSDQTDHYDGWNISTKLAQCLQAQRDRKKNRKGKMKEQKKVDLLTSDLNNLCAEWLCKKEEPKFICDEMLEGLARQLRSCGIDASSVSQPSEESIHFTPSKQNRSDPASVAKQLREKKHHIRQLLYRQMVEKSDEEDRIILTSDSRLLSSKLNNRVFLVSSSIHGKRSQLKCVLNAFDILVTEDNLFTRCIKCNGSFELVNMEESAATAVLQSAVPEKLLKSHEEFWICKGCNQIYWEGARFQSAYEHLRTSLTTL